MHLRYLYWRYYPGLGRWFSPGIDDSGAGLDRPLMNLKLDRRCMARLYLVAGLLGLLSSACGAEGDAGEPGLPGELGPEGDIGPIGPRGLAGELGPGGPTFHVNCQWSVSDAESVNEGSTLSCSDGEYAAAGSCEVDRSSGARLRWSIPLVAGSVPTNGTLGGATASAWACSFDVPGNHRTATLCCPLSDL